MKKWIFGIIMLAVGGTVGWMLFQEPGGDSGFSVTSEDAAALLSSDSSLVVLDVRTEGEFRSNTGHLKGAILIPVQELSDRMKELEPLKDKSLLVYCRTDNRSRRATSMLREAGYDARFIVGGISRWNREGLPVEREETP